MFLDLKNQYCENDYNYPKQFTDSMQSLKITNGIFHRTRKLFFFTICMETEETPNSQSNLEKEKWN